MFVVLPSSCSPQLAERYGNVFTVRFGGDTMVIVWGYKTVKETLATQAENFVDRPYNAVADRFYSEPEGVASLQVFHTSHMYGWHGWPFNLCALTSSWSLHEQWWKVEETATVHLVHPTHLRPGQEHAGTEHLRGDPIPAGGTAEGERLFSLSMWLGHNPVKALTFSLSVRWTVHSGWSLQQRRVQRHLSAGHGEEIWLQRPQLSDHAEAHVGFSLVGGEHMGSGESANVPLPSVHVSSTTTWKIDEGLIFILVCGYS